MQSYYKLLPLLGIFLTGVILALLLSSPGDIFTTKLYFSTTPNLSIETSFPIFTKYNLTNQEELNEIPIKIGELNSITFSSPEIKEYLNASSLLTREYITDQLNHVAFLTIVQSGSQSSIHPPPVCYFYQGYAINNEHIEYIKLTNTTWLENNPGQIDKLPNWAQDVLNPRGGIIPVNSLIAEKVNEERVVERILVLYFYIIDNSASNNAFNLIRLSSIAPVQGNYESNFSDIKALMAEIIPILFQPNLNTERPIIEHLMMMGSIKFILLVLVFLIPLSLFIIPILYRYKYITK